MATLLVYGRITNGITIWDKFTNYFCDGLPHQLQDWPNISEDLTNPYYDYGLYFFSELLKKSGERLKQYRLLLPNHTWQPDNSIFQRKLDYDPMYEVLLEVEKAATFNIEQRKCFKRVILADDFVRKGTRPYFFI